MCSKRTQALACRLPIVMREFLFSGQPVINVIPVLTPARLEEVICKPGDLISGRAVAAACVLRQRVLACQGPRDICQSHCYAPPVSLTQSGICLGSADTSRSHFVGTRIGAPLCFTKNTTNFAGAVWLAFRATMCTSSGPS